MSIYRSYLNLNGLMKLHYFGFSLNTTPILNLNSSLTKKLLVTYRHMKFYLKLICILCDNYM